MKAIMHGQECELQGFDGIQLADKDRELRGRSICVKCSLPKEGLVRAGQSIKQAGLCVCEIVADGQMELNI